MARDFNQNRNTNAHLGNVDEPIKKPGTFYAATYGYDGISYFNVDFPDFVKDFIQGNNDTFEYFVPNNITSIRPYAFSGFPNLNDVTILNETSEVTINANAFNGTKIGNKEQGSKIWVVETYYDDYVSHYGSLYNFASFESETWYVVNYEKVGTSTLTKQLLNNLNIPLTFNGLVIASDITYVTSISVSELVSIEQMWFKALNNLIFDLDELPNGWVYDNGTLYVSPADYDTFIANHSGYENYIVNGYELTISGSGTLTSEIVENDIDDLALTEVPIGIVNKLVVPNTFTNVSSNPFTDITVILPNVEKLELKGNTSFYRTNALSWVKELTLNDYSGTHSLYYSGLVQAGYTFIFKGTQFVNLVDTSWAKNIIAETQETISGFGLTNWRGKADIYAPKAKIVNTFYGAPNSKLYFPSLETFNSVLGGQYDYWGFIYIVKPNIELTGTINQSYLPKKPNAQDSQFSGFVTQYNLLENYMNKVDSNWEKIRNAGCLFGVLHICSTLPTFTGQEVGNFIGQIYYDKETNKQWKWTENGWVEYANGFPIGYYDDTVYTEQWYSDDRLANAISVPTSASADGDYYLKLTAI